MSQIIERTLKSLPGNWTKGAISEDGTKMCVMAHLIDNSEIELKDYLPARQALEAVVMEQYHDRTTYTNSYNTVAAFNDHPDTTESDVIAVLEKANARLDEVS